MSKKLEFVKYINNVLTYLNEIDAPLAPMNEDAQMYWAALCSMDEGDEKPTLTDNGKKILAYMREHTEQPLWKAREIAMGLFISSRGVSGAMRKLANDGFIEKMNTDSPVIYTLTEKGKTFEIEE